MGIWMLATAFLIMVTYATVAGWVLLYGWEALTGSFTGLNGGIEQRFCRDGR